MSDMKCPFCQQELEINDLDVQLLGCENQNCKHSIHYDTVGTKELWQELIKLMENKDLSDKIGKLETELDRTRKALDVAKDTIRHADWFFDGDYNVDGKTMHNEIKCAIKGITALEQKDQQ